MSLSTSSRSASCTLSDVLRLAEHGSVEEFAAALSLARYDLESAMRLGLAYNFDATKQYMRVLLIHQRRDILEWLLENDEITSSMAANLLVEACKQPSLSFFLWLQRKLSRYCWTDDLEHQQFQTAMEHGAGEVASYIFANLGMCLTADAHPNVQERKEPWPHVLNCVTRSGKFYHILVLMASGNRTCMTYALAQAPTFLSCGMKCPAQEREEYLNYLDSNSPYRPSSMFATWVGWCVDSINKSLEQGHWGYAKLITAALQEALPNHFPYEMLRYFCVKHPERLNEKDMVEMVEWSVNCLVKLLDTSSVRGEKGLGGHHLVTRAEVEGGQRISCSTIARAFVEACDNNLPLACKALLENDRMAQIIENELALFGSRPAVFYIYSLFGGNLRRSSTIATLVKHGMQPKQLRRVTNIFHVWKMDPEWVDWAISGNLRSIAGEKTGDLEKDILQAFSGDNADLFAKEPYVSMPLDEKLEALRWIGKLFVKSPWLQQSSYLHEVLSHPLVTAKNLFDFIRPEESHCLPIIRELIIHPRECDGRSPADVEDIVNVLLKDIPVTKDVLPLPPPPPTPEVQKREFEMPLHLRKGFSTWKEASELLVSPWFSEPTVAVVCVIKAHVMRLEAQLEELDQPDKVHVCDNGSDAGGGNHTSSESTTHSSPLHQSHGEVVEHIEARKNNLRMVIRHYCSLGFGVASSNNVLAFDKSRWFLDRLRSSATTSRDSEQASSAQHRDLFHRHKEQEGEKSEQDETTSKEVHHPRVPITVPVLPALVEENYGSNMKLLEYWRKSIGLPSTLQLYIDLMYQTYMSFLDRHDVSFWAFLGIQPWSNRIFCERLRPQHLEQLFRTTTSLFVPMHRVYCKTGLQNTGDCRESETRDVCITAPTTANSQLVSFDAVGYLHNCLCIFVAAPSHLWPTCCTTMLQVNSISAAMAEMLEAVEAVFTDTTVPE